MLDAGFVSLVQPSNSALQIAYPLTNQPSAAVAPTQYTRQYSPEIYAVVFNGLTEGSSTVSALEQQTRSQQAAISAALLNPPPLENAPVSVPVTQPVAQAPSNPTPAVSAPASSAPAAPTPPPAAAQSAPAVPASQQAPASDPATASSQVAATAAQTSAGTPNPPAPAEHTTGLAPAGSGA